MVSVLSGSPYSVIGASIRGASHKRSRKPNQDSFKIIQEPDVLILAAADGHGSESSPYSKSGSLIAVNAFCKTMSEYCRVHADDWDALRVMLNRDCETTISRKIDSDWKRNVLKSNRARQKKGDEGNEEVWRMYGTTLLGVVITPAFVFAYQLGDGDIVFSSENKTERVIIGALMLGTATHSLSSFDSWKRAKTKVYSVPNKDEACAFHISTDGFSNSYRDEQTFLCTALDYFKTINEHGVEAVKTNIKSWLNETSKNGSGDDITMLIAYRADE